MYEPDDSDRAEVKLARDHTVILICLLSLFTLHIV